MKFTRPELPTDRFKLELTRRNLETLLAKLDDPLSVRTLVDPDDFIEVMAVENDAHYKTRPPGEVYMPTTGEHL